MADRYFAESPITGSSAELTGPEAHHLAHVMRAKVGTEVTLFDGTGQEFAAQVQRVGRSTIELTITSAVAVDRELNLEVTIGVALPKGDRQRWLIEKLTELGTHTVVPLITHRTVAQPYDSALAKLRRGVIEASKQCGRNRLLQIAEPLIWETFMQQTPGSSVRLLAHPSVESAVAENGPSSWINRAASASQIACAIGPEGGLTDEEVQLASAAGWQTVNLGQRILRVETAAVAMMAAIALPATSTSLD
ncbi:MAG: 16S rRNA (uracil(1498)-N(3))-methyltransferase [Planctomycetota bacterium]|nr:16S rRNA (uracil(1498)-N(3))-methyltransferase [Planctomycetota bacterium]